MTKFLKSSELNSNWYEIDAKDAVVGRLASIIAMIVRGKNKTNYTPHMDDGDFVVVKMLNKQSSLEINLRIKNIINTQVILVELKK